VKAATTLRDALHGAAARLSGLATARRDAQLLLLRVLGRDRAWLFAHPDGVLSEAQARQFDEWIERRSRHEPVQYIVGETEFYGLTLKVTPDVLIPRPETEHLVEAVLRRLSPGSVARIADVGTGSGAIAIALAHALPRAEVTGLDISVAALEVARQNAVRCEVNGRIRWLKSDLLAAVRGESFDAIVSNPPYVADAEILEPQVRLYEPREALFAGPTGLEVYRRLIPEAGEALRPGGWLLLEIGQGQRDALRDLLADWDGVEFVDDVQGIPRVAIARRHG
jgi:release factor glutamine methyltransferase